MFNFSTAFFRSAQAGLLLLVFSILSPQCVLAQSELQPENAVIIGAAISDAHIKASAEQKLANPVMLTLPTSTTTINLPLLEPTSVKTVKNPNAVSTPVVSTAQNPTPVVRTQGAPLVKVNKNYDASPPKFEVFAGDVPKTAPTFDISADDLTLSISLRKWGKQAGYQIVWDAPKDLMAVNASYAGPIIDAVTKLMGDTAYSDYPLHACAYQNKVFRILHVSQPCIRS